MSALSPHFLAYRHLQSVAELREDLDLSPKEVHALEHLLRRTRARCSAEEVEILERAAEKRRRRQAAPEPGNASAEDAAP